MREGESERTDELDRRAIAHVGALQLLHESRLVLQLLRHAPAGGAVGTIGTAQAQLLRVSRTCCRLVAVSINSTGTISPAVPNTVLSTSVASTPAQHVASRPPCATSTNRIRSEKRRPGLPAAAQQLWPVRACVSDRHDPGLHSHSAHTRESGAESAQPEPQKSRRSPNRSVWYPWQSTASPSRNWIRLPW